MRPRTSVATGLLAAGLLAVLLPLTLARLLQPEARPAVWLVAFTPLGLPGYGLALLAALAHGWASRRRLLRALPAVVAAAGLALHGWWAAPLLAGANPPPSAAAEPLVVVSANVYGGAGDAVELVRLASAARAGLMVVAEVTPQAWERMRSAGLDEVFAHYAGEPADDYGGTMVFATEPIGEVRRLDTVYGGWHVEVGDLTVLAVHPAAPTEPEAWRKDHTAVLRAAVDGDADLVVGDLNATLDHAPLQRLLDAGYRDAAELANQGWQPTWPSNGLFQVLGVPLPPFAAIDHVLVGRSWAALDTRTVALDGTDHRVLVAELAAK